MTQATTSNGAYTSQHDNDERARFLPAVAAGEVQAAANSVEQYVRGLVREQPVVAVFTAVGIGYFMARIFARGMR